MDQDNNIIIGKRNDPYTANGQAPHPTLIGGKDPVVKCAGMPYFHKGKIKAVDTNSGHYRPNSKSPEKVYCELRKLHKKTPDIFDRNFKLE